MKKLQAALPWPDAPPGTMSSKILATLSGIAANHARMHLVRLEYLGLIECIKPQRQGSKTPGLYRLTEAGRAFDPCVG